jgi:hybrid cluster-associated redox disulfide protein
MAKVTKDMIIIDVLKMDPDCAQIFFKNGLHCIGCPSASGESIEEASAVHGLDPNKLINELNDYFES